MSSVSEVSSSTIQADYMKLMIEQLRNQNPLEPMNNNEMASQLALFSQLQQLESMNTSFSDVLATTQHSYANSLIGKEITFLTETESGELTDASGTIREVVNDPEAGNLLIIETADGDYTLTLDGIISVKNPI
jgi:flagellar basal-body rod modification protein FlgD